MTDDTIERTDFLRVSEAKARYLGGKMSLRWWYKQVETGALPHTRAGSVVLLAPEDVEAFIATMARSSKSEPAQQQPVPEPSSPRSPTRGGLRFFGVTDG